jgi:hypothetical protein
MLFIDYICLSTSKKIESKYFILTNYLYKINFSLTTMRKHYLNLKLLLTLLIMSLFFMVACDMKAQVRKTFTQRTAAAAPNSVIYNIKETLR